MCTQSVPRGLPLSTRPRDFAEYGQRRTYGGMDSRRLAAQIERLFGATKKDAPEAPSQQLAE